MKGIDYGICIVYFCTVLDDCKNKVLSIRGNNEKLTANTGQKRNRILQGDYCER
jgi:hypothetical protein